MLKLRKLLVAATFFLSGALAAACPRVATIYIDSNCDRTFKIAVTGDSIVYGVGDTEREGGGGYVSRIAALNPDISVENIGVPGVNTHNLLRAFKKMLPKMPPGATRAKSSNADVFMIDVGRNDYWLKRKPSYTVSQLKRLVKYLRTELTAIDGYEPMIVIATLLPTNRKYQQPFINGVNALLSSQKSDALPVFVRYDSVDPKILSYDGLHPTSKGYDAISSVTNNFIHDELQRMLRRRVTDLDRDGIYDQFEGIRFGTSPQLTDTDGDGLSDGDEVFKLGTNPLIPEPSPSPTPSI